MRELTCIVCPNGCSIKIGNKDSEWQVEGNLCNRGREFAISEMTNPKRTVCSTVRTVYKEMPRLPVRTDGEVPLGSIFSVMGSINKVTLDHKVHAGEVIIEDVCGAGINIISTGDMYEN